MRRRSTVKFRDLVSLNLIFHFFLVSREKPNGFAGFCRQSLDQCEQKVQLFYLHKLEVQFLDGLVKW